MVTREEFIQDTQDSFTNFKDLVHCLERFVLRTCSLQRNQNPLIKNLDSLTADDIKFVIQEYSQFSHEAIHLLLDARIRVHEWKKLTEEIDRNIDEEKGSQTSGVPHLEMARKGYLSGFNFDTNGYEPSEMTKVFLTSLKKVVRRKNNPYLSGVLLALESVSIPEFYVLDALVAKYMDCSGREPNTNLTNYIEGHKLFEVGHKEGLVKALDSYIGVDQATEFSSGYLTACGALSEWWHNLAKLLKKETL